MTIWILAVLLLAAEAGLGLRQGAIRVAFSLAGIVLGGLLANPLGHLLIPVLPAIGIKHPFLHLFVPPVIVFVLIVGIFKIGGYALHRKVEVFYKYKSGELRLALWKRLNSRLGMCLAPVNGTLYLILIAFAVYIFSYWSVQLATSSTTPKGLKLLSRLGRDLQGTGMVGVARALDRMPPLYYELADLAGLVYNNPGLKSRLYQYPPFIGLAEQPEYQGLVNDTFLAQSWLAQMPVIQLIKTSSAYSILKERESLEKFWGMLQPDLRDLGAYLNSGQSPKYDKDTILGRWNFDVNGTIGLARRSRPNITAKEMGQLKNSITASFSTTTFVAMTDHRSILKSYPRVRTSPGAAPTVELVNVPGQWTQSGDRYALTYNADGRSEEAAVEVDGDRLRLTGPGLELSFQREY